MADNTNVQTSLMAQLGEYLAEKMRYAGVDIDLVTQKVKEKLGVDGDIPGGGNGGDCNCLDEEITITPTNSIGSIRPDNGEQSMSVKDWIKAIVRSIVDPRITTNITEYKFYCGDALEKDSVSVNATASAGSAEVTSMVTSLGGSAQGNTITMLIPDFSRAAGTSSSQANKKYTITANAADGGKAEANIEVKMLYDVFYNVGNSQEMVGGNHGNHGETKSINVPAKGILWVSVPTILNYTPLVKAGDNPNPIEPNASNADANRHNIPYTLYKYVNDTTDSFTYSIKL